MDRVRRRIQTRAAATHRLFPVRRTGGRGAESRPAGADRRAGQRHEPGSGLRHRREARSGDPHACPASTTCSSRRTSTPRRCSWTSTACRPPSSGLTQKEVVSNVITALTSNAMIAPSYWVDPEERQRLMLTVQYPEDAVKTLDDLQAIPLRASQPAGADPPRCGGAGQHGPGTHRGRPLPAAPRDRCLRRACARGPRAADRRRREASSQQTTLPEGVRVSCAARCRACALPSPASASA